MCFVQSPCSKWWGGRGVAWICAWNRKEEGSCSLENLTITTLEPKDCFHRRAQANLWRKLFTLTAHVYANEPTKSTGQLLLNTAPQMNNCCFQIPVTTCTDCPSSGGACESVTWSVAAQWPQAVARWPEYQTPAWHLNLGLANLSGKDTFLNHGPLKNVKKAVPR